MSLRNWGPVVLLAAACACVALSLRARTVAVSATGAFSSPTEPAKGLQMEADTSRLADHHLWITIRIPAQSGNPARTVRYDAYREVLTHYGDSRKIPSSFTLAPATPHAGSGV